MKYKALLKNYKSWHFHKKPEFIITTGLGILILLTLLLFNKLVLFLFPVELGYNKNCNIETLKIVTIIFGGLLILVQIYLTNRRTKAAEDNLRILESGQVQKRFNNAIDQLGNASEAVNLGAIYTLHHVATDSPKFTKSVFDILCSYIRQTTLSEEYKSVNSTKPSIKIQSILNLLFIEEDERKTYTHLHANLFEAYLSGANLSKAIFSDANLNGVNLSLANLNYSQFGFTKLRYANLSDANLTKAHIQISDLTSANLTGARLMGSNVFRSQLDNAKFDNILLNDKDWFQTLISSECNGIDKLTDLYFLVEEERKGRKCYRINKIPIKDPHEEDYSIE